ncbi:MAG: hypothetical protein U1F06_05585 [Steroidobacteraceae bacterium]
MRRAHVITALVVLGLGGLVAWIAMNTYWETLKVPGAMHGEALRNPYYAAERLAQRLGARLEALPDTLAPLPAAGQVLLLTDTNLDLQPERRRALEEWVMRRPPAARSQRRVRRDRARALGRRHAGALPDPRRGRKAQGHGDASGRDGDGTDDGNGSGDDDGEADAPASLPELLQRQSCVSYPHRGDGSNAGALQLCDFQAATRLRSARPPDFALGDGDGLQALRVPLGRGSLALLNAVRPFDNRDLLRGDHGLLFATLARARSPAQRSGRWTAALGPGLLGFIWNRAAGVVLLCAAALAAALWRAATRGPLRAPAAPMRRFAARAARGQARFLQARGGEAALLQASLRAFEAVLARRLPAHQRLAPAERYVAMARLTGLSPAELQVAVKGTPGRGHTELVRRLGLLEHARRRLLDQGREKQAP